MSSRALIHVNNLVKKYHESKTASLNGISFDVQCGELFAFLGPNGAGKTTTISILTTLLSKTSGDVYIDNLHIESDQSSIRRLIGVIFQNPSLDKNLSAEENVRFQAFLYGQVPFAPTYFLMPDTYKKHISELASILGIQRDMKKPIRNFSGGMKRKLEIVRALMHDPKILFLDEPTAGLDPASRRTLWEYLNYIRTIKGITVFLTTHYLEEAENADTVCIINAGQITYYGKPHELKMALCHQSLLVDSHQRPRLLDEIRTHGYSFEGDGPFRITIKSQDASALARIVQSFKTPLSFLQTRQPTLEEAYLEIIKRQRDT
jgi:ABC-2 type transport system ATP-binding protein